MDLTQILIELTAERTRLDHAINALEGLNLQQRPRRGRPPKAKVAQPAPAKRKMSLSARKRSSAAMKQRWARWKGKSVPKKSAAPAKSAKNSAARKPMSAAMRKKLSAMMKARWAARKKAT